MTQFVIGAAALLPTGILAWLVAQFNRHKEVIAELYATVLAIASASGSPKPTPALLAATATKVGVVGGGQGVSSVNLRAWSQNNDPLPDGRQDAYATSDCGEECAAEVIYACTGVTLSAGDVRFQLGGPQRQGLTNGPDLVQALGLSGVPATSLALAGPDTWAATAANLAKGRPVLLLGTWLGSSALHWIAATSIRGGDLNYNDPWDGTRRKGPRSFFHDNYAGIMVRVDREVLPNYLG